MDEEELPSREAHRITISYGFDSDGAEYVTIESDEEMSNVLILGMIEIAKNRILNPELYESDQEEEY